MTKMATVLRVLLLGITIATAGSVRQRVCDLPGCSCRNETSDHITGWTAQADVSGRTDKFDVAGVLGRYDVTCFVKAVDMSDRTINQLPPEVTSIGLVCSDDKVHSYLTSGLFRHAPNIRQLGLINCNFFVVSGVVFQDIPQLQSLEISDSHFASDLPSDFISSLPQVTQLSLTESALHHLPALCNLRNLEFLNVSHQLLQSFDGSLAGCNDEATFSRLQVVDITSNLLQTLPQQFLLRAPDLRELYISSNQLHTINFQFPRLEVLEATGQEMTDADFADMSFVRGLRTLKVVGDGNTTFPIEKLRDAANLTRLHLENFDVSDSIWDILPNMPNLTHLNLASNRVVNISFGENDRLLYLNMTRNQITRIEQHAFSSLSGLTVLDLSWNNMTVISGDVLSTLGSLTHLYLSHNRLRMLFYNSLDKLYRLQRLYLDHNELHTLPMYLLRNLTSLQEFDVSSNGLLMWPYLDGLTELFSLIVNYNQLRILLPSRFKDLRSLEFLFLRGNLLTTLDPTMFESCPLLRVLDLRENQIFQIEAFPNLPTLSAILLDDNDIQDIERTFTSLPSLETLFIPSNLLTKLTSSMLPTTLRFLHAGGNLISYIDPLLFVGLPALRVVSLETNNHLYKVTMQQVQVSPMLQPKPTFVIAPNVFYCDCHMGYLKAWEQHRDTAVTLAANLPVFDRLEVLQCFTYFSKEQVPFAGLPLSDFVCPYQETECDAGCTCCWVDQTGLTRVDPACTCALTCPAGCECFHGGSEYVKLYVHVICGSKNLTKVPDGIPPRATHLRLDGNNLTFLRNDSLTHATDAMFMYLNHSQLTTIEPGSFEYLDDLVILDISHNMLQNISDNTFGAMRSLNELYLQYNSISYIHPKAFTDLSALSVVRLDHNDLKSVDSFEFFPPLNALFLAGNTWSCNCNFTGRFLKFLFANSEDVKDYFSIRCFWCEGDADRLQKMQTSNKTVSDVIDYVPLPSGTARNNSSELPSTLLLKFQYDVLCPETRVVPVFHYVHFFDESSHVAAIATVLSVAVVAVVVGSLLVWKKREAQAWVYDKFGLRLWDKVSQLDRDQETGGKDADNKPRPPLLYDAFVSYSHEDEDFVVHAFAPRLEEQGPRTYRLCLHYRDFPVGGFIADTIIDSIESSKRTLLLLSERFLSSEWCRFEFQAAHRHILREGDHRLIIILLTDVKEENLYPDLKIAMKTHTYLRADDPWFWEKLYFALPDAPRTKHAQREGPGADRPVQSQYFNKPPDGEGRGSGDGQANEDFSTV